MADTILNTTKLKVGEWDGAVGSKWLSTYQNLITEARKYENDPQGYKLQLVVGDKRDLPPDTENIFQPKKKRIRAADEPGGSLNVWKLPKKLDPNIHGVEKIREKISGMNQKAMTRFQRQLRREINKNKHETLVGLLDHAEKTERKQLAKRKRALKSKLSKLF